MNPANRPPGDHPANRYETTGERARTVSLAFPVFSFDSPSGAAATENIDIRLHRLTDRTQQYFRLVKLVSAWHGYDMAIPDFQTLLLPVLSACKGGEVRMRDVVDQIATQLGLTPDERAELQPSGSQPIFYNRAHWAKTFLVKAGLLVGTRRGYVKITPRGQELLATNPQDIKVATLKQFDEFNQFMKNTSAVNERSKVLVVPIFEEEKDTPDEAIRNAHRQIEEALAQELLLRVRSSSSEFFERLIVNLLRKMNFSDSSPEAARTLGRSGDGGVDGVIDQDSLGLDRIYIQAKRYKDGSNIGPGPIREFFGSLDQHKATKGLFVTASTFTKSAKAAAESLGKRIVLIDGEHLTRLMIRYGVGVRDEDTFVIKRIDEDFFGVPD